MMSCETSIAGTRGVCLARAVRTAVFALALRPFEACAARADESVCPAFAQLSVHTVQVSHNVSGLKALPTVHARPAGTLVDICAVLTAESGHAAAFLGYASLPRPTFLGRTGLSLLLKRLAGPVHAAGFPGTMHHHRVLARVWRLRAVPVLAPRGEVRARHEAVQAHAIATDTKPMDTAARPQAAARRTHHIMGPVAAHERR